MHGYQPTWSPQSVGVPAAGRSVRIVVNPAAGGSDAGRAVRRLCRALTAAGFEPTAVPTRAPEHAREMAASAEVGTAAVVAAGGDGTVREVAEGLAGRQVPMAVFPIGTENLFGNWAGWPRDPALWATAFAAGRTTCIDLGRVVTGGGGSPRYFAVLAGIGFDAEVLVRLNRTRRGHITKFTYLQPILRTGGSYRWPPLRVVADGKVVAQRAGIVVIANIARYALGLPVVPGARPDDGLLDASIFDCRSVWQLGLHAARTVLNRHLNRPGVQSVRAARFEIDSTADVGWELDGDPFGRLPATFESARRALRVRVPPEFTETTVDGGASSAGLTRRWDGDGSDGASV